MRKLKINIELEILTEKENDKVSSALTRGIIRGLDTDGNYIAKPSNVSVKGITFEELKQHYSEIKFKHVPTNKIYTCDGAGGIVNENKDSPLPLWVTENSKDWEQY